MSLKHLECNMPMAYPIISFPMPSFFYDPTECHHQPLILQILESSTSVSICWVPPLNLASGEYFGVHCLISGFLLLHISLLPLLHLIHPDFNLISLMATKFLFPPEAGVLIKVSKPLTFIIGVRPE